MNYLRALSTCRTKYLRGFNIVTFALAILSALLVVNVGAQVPVATPKPGVEEKLQVPAVAPDFRASERPLPELNRVGVDPDRQQPLTLQEALKLALANNKDIEVARQTVRIAEFDLSGARGAYDPRLSMATYYERIKTPVSNFLSGGSNGAITSGDFTGTARLEGQSPKLGGNYRFDFSSIRQTTNNQFTGLSPLYPSSLTFTYTQPLLRGLKFDSNRRQIEIAKKNLSLTDAEFRQRAIETITNVQRAYWDLVFSLRNLQVQRDAVRDARAQLEHNKRLVAEGSLAPIDIVAAEAQIAGFEQTLFTALEEVGRAENNLKSLIAETQQAEIWSRSLVPVDAVDPVPPVVTLSQAMKAAVENRPELQQANVAREINEIDQKYFRDQTKPAIDFVGSYGMVGSAGLQTDTAINPFSSTAELRDRVNLLSELAGVTPPLPAPPPQTFPASLIGGYGQSIQNLFGNRYNNFRVGVQISLPLKNRTAEAQLGRSLVEGERIKTLREKLEETIQVEVRNALQSLQSSEARLRAAVAARKATEQQYESEKRKLDAGQSTVFLVLERQTAFTAARGNELRAQTELNKATAELQRAMGSSLAVNSVIVSVH
jgi:HAE1 family hydrophobic/amphiphilic exporter-1